MDPQGSPVHGQGLVHYQVQRVLLGTWASEGLSLPRCGLWMLAFRNLDGTRGQWPPPQPAIP